MKYKKVVSYECHNCKTTIHLPGLVYHAENGTPVCAQCGRGLIRHVKKVEVE